MNIIDKEKQNELKQRLKVIKEERNKRSNKDSGELDNKNIIKSPVLSHSEWRKREQELQNREKEEYINKIYEINENERIQKEKCEKELLKKEEVERQNVKEELLEKKEVERERFLMELDFMSNKIKGNEKIKKLIEHFFNKAMPQKIFLDDRVILHKLVYLYNNCPLENLALLSDERYLVSQEYGNEKYNMLLELIKRYTSYDNEIILELSVWNLLSEIAVKYFSKEWMNLCGSYVNDMSNLPIEKCIDIYYGIDFIDIYANSNKLLFTYYLMDNEKFNDIVSDLNNQILCFREFNKVFNLREKEILKKKELDNFEKMLYGREDRETYTINEIDIMTGIEFEIFIEKLFQCLGYTTVITKASGDQGVDLIIVKNNYKIGVQAKCYSNKVSNSAIQEVVAGRKYYKCDKVMVVTNNFFTKSAVELAKVNDVTLWNRETLNKKIKEIF
ncbi:restriction endonuclease [Clostridium estertheticum]|nr:restriction endonuclease [Clostridium estertheticum]WBL47736.1 restriction endonuclease [Clostridium estertheticum]